MKTQDIAAAIDAPECFVLPIRVYYEDTDAAGVVYYANYLRFCERARTEWLRALGFEQRQMLAEHGVAFVVRALSADYVSSARLDDALTVETRISKLGRASLVFSQKVLRGSELLFDSLITIACVDTRRKRPASLPNPLRTLLQSRVQT
ncbi:MAG TPA: tol-pal system-associated acyl-CoA thioesterase [Rhodocyclaceae bacterium]|nr:tol-pal system-associated acyl-CoA thioesterase [Rhodocyclaceae bacterium]